MKKIVLITVLFLQTTFMYAQTLVSFGLKGGINMPNVSNSSDIQAQYDLINAKTTVLLYGFTVGSIASFELTDNLNLFTEFDFIQKGFNLNIKDLYNEAGDEYIDELDMTNRFSFIEFTPSISYDITKQLLIKLGPFLGFAISGKRELLDYDPTIGYTSSFYNVNFKNDEISRWDYGFNIGFSYVINNHTSLNTGYCLGLSNLKKNADLGGSQKTTGIYLTVGYLFDNKK